MSRTLEQAVRQGDRDPTTIPDRHWEMVRMPSNKLTERWKAGAYEWVQVKENELGPVSIKDLNHIDHLLGTGKIISTSRVHYRVKKSSTEENQLDEQALMFKVAEDCAVLNDKEFEDWYEIWLAMDKGGSIYAYSGKPIEDRVGWDNTTIDDEDLRYKLVWRLEGFVGDWTKTLVRVR